MDRSSIAVGRQKPAAAALIQALAWEPPYTAGAALKKKKKRKKERKRYFWKKINILYYIMKVIHAYDENLKKCIKR